MLTLPILLSIIQPVVPVSAAELNEGTVQSGRYLTYDLKDASNNTVTKLATTETSKTVFLKGDYEVGGLPFQQVTVRYQVLGKNVNEPINEGIIANTFTVNDSNENASFNKSLTLKTSGSCIAADEVCLPNTTSSYSVRVFIDYGTGADYQVYTQLYKTFSVERTTIEGYKNVATDTQLAIEQGHFKMTVKDINKNAILQGNEYFSRSAMKLTEQTFLIDGHVRVTGDVGKRVNIRYDFIDYDSYLNKAKNEGLIETYTQTAYTDGSFVKFNRTFGVKVSSGEAAASVNYNIIPDMDRDYVIRVVVEVDGKDRYLEDIPVHVATTAGTPTGNVGTGLHETVPSLGAGEEINYTLKRNGTNLTTVPLTDIRANRVKLDLLGVFQDINIPSGDEVIIRYKITSIDSPYFKAKEELIGRYMQTTYTQNNKMSFNRTLYIKSDANPEAESEPNPTIHLKDYPATYTFLVEAVFGENQAVTVQKTMEFKVTGSQQAYFDVTGDTPPFPTKTNLEFKLSKYAGSNLTEIANTETNQSTVSPILASDIKATPLRLNIDGSFVNKVDGANDNIIIQYDVTALENYSDLSSVNKVVKTFTESVHTEGRIVEFNRDFWISTESRTNRASDNAEGTIYVEDYTQYYTVRVTAKNTSKGTTVVLRDIKILVKASQETHQQTEGPGFVLPDGLSSYFFDKDGNRVETLEITARDLNNAENGIDIDVQGFFKSNWTANQNVNITYELKALNSYKDYIKFPTGIEETLELDFNDAVNGTNPQEFVSRTVVDPMEKWLDGKATQTGFFKEYTATTDTLNRHEPFMRKFNLRTKLDKDLDIVKNDESVLILDNVARSYELFVYATNKSTNEVETKVINLKITTVKPDGTITNAKPIFERPVGVSRPETGTGWFIEETMPMRWDPAVDADNELMYYKTYYYYTTTDANGLVNNEIRNWIQRVEDMPVSGSTLAYDWVVDNPAKIEPVNVRAIACDINHVCSDPTRSNPFKLNEFGIQPGTGGGGSGGGGRVSASIAIYPKPDGKWTPTDIEVSVMYDGEAKLVEGATKTYKITNSSAFPTSLITPLPADGNIVMSANGNNYVHVQYELSSGQVINATAGPYKIDKSNIDGFEIRLENADGDVVTDWTNETLHLVMTNPTTTSVSYTSRQYMIEGFHNTWQPYRDDIQIAIDGNYRVFGRVVNGAGTFSEQKFATAKIDKIKPTFDELKLTKLPTDKFDVSALTYDGDSGVSKVVLSTGKELAMNGSPISWVASNLTTEPLAIRVYDKAGNVSADEGFLSLPTVAFQDSYTTSASIWRKDVIASIGGNGLLSYKLSNKSYGCSTNPCDVTISKNATFTAIHKQGIQTTSVITSFENIDKSPIRLVLNAERDVTTPGKITFQWNHDLASGTLTCDYPGGTKTYNVSGLGAILNGLENTTYTCNLTGAIYGENVKSNSLTIYPDYGKELAEEVIGGGNVTDQVVNDAINVYVEESRLGTTYTIGTRKNNSKDGIVPLPDGMFQ